MPLPSFVTSENVKFNGTMDNAVVLDDDSGTRTLILWDNLSIADQELLTEIVTNFGGTVPLASPTAGVASVSFSSNVIGSTATGLSNVSTSTAGVATINVGGNKTGSSSSGLSTSHGTSGSNTVNFYPGVESSTQTGQIVAESGYQNIEFSVSKAGTDATGLANDATVYTATFTVDSVAKLISVVGSAAQTFTDLIDEINTDLGISGSATLDGDIIIVTSATMGTSSSVEITDGTLLTTLTDFSAVADSVPGVGSIVALTSTITIDGTDYVISVMPSDITTFEDLVDEINAVLTSNGEANLVGGDLKVTSASSGLSSTVVIAPETLFPALDGYIGVLPPANGDDTSRKYGATVVIDDKITKTINFVGIDGDTFQHVLDEINADLGSSATASLSGGNIIITSATTGINSSVKIYDSGMLCSSLSGYVKISDVKGNAPTLYTASIVVDGVVKTISVQGSAAQTFTTLVSELNTDLGASATASISGGKVKLTSSTTGLDSSVKIYDNTLFKSLTNFVSISDQLGAINLVDALKVMKSPAGNSLYEHFAIVVVGTKPAVLPYTPHTTDFIYYDGSAWLYLDDDTTV